MDEIFSHLLTLTTYVSRRFICFIDNLVRQEINKCTEDMLVVSSGQHPRSSGHSISEPNLEQHACSYVTCGAETRVRIGGREVFDVLVEVPVNTGSEIIESNYSYLGGPFVFQGMMLPAFGLKVALRLALASWRVSFYYLRSAQHYVRSVTSRVKTTFRGSSDDIGWLQNTPGMASVEDGTARFLELLEDLRYQVLIANSISVNS
ncbi:uncharacterized protein LOC110816296 isoform X2 [Carica papaya]|nr:uncharacterized protein LOC110816296 isoform X2 [Carica papaya]XP_021900123.1 uncharacterized protein LOC110816296 isoform X2 [Carica papaya]